MKKLTPFLLLLLTINGYAQIKVFSGGKISMGATTSPLTGNTVQVFGQTMFSTATSGANSAALIRANYTWSTDDNPDYTWRGDSATGFFHPATQTIGFTIAGTEAMRINSSRQLGVGVSPSYTLHVKGTNAAFDTQGDMRVYINHNTSSNNGSIIFTTGGAGTSNGWAEIGLTGDNNLHFKANASAGSYSDRMVILGSNGNVGIGNTSPGNKLEVTSGNINVASASSAYGYMLGGNKVLWNNGNTDDLFIGITSGNNTMSGHESVYVGNETGKSTTSANRCTFVGYLSGRANTTGIRNSFFGHHSGYSNTTGQQNVFVGWQTGYTNSTGEYNTYVGRQAGYYSTASHNTFLGSQAGLNCTGNNSVMVGSGSGSVVTSGNNNTCVGYSANVAAACSTSSNMTAIGYSAVATSANDITLGNSSVTSIHAAVTTITAISDGRFKTNVKEDVKGLEFINKLRPVTYNLNTEALDDYMIAGLPDSIKTIHKQDLDFVPSQAVTHSGFIAQEVEQAAQASNFNSSIVYHPKNNNDPYGLGYAEIVVPLVKAVQELSKATDSLKLVTEYQQSKINDCCGKPVDGTFRKTINNEENISGVSNAENVSYALLYQNAPNPFSNTTTIKYRLPKNCNNASILIFDLQGKLFKTYALNNLTELQIKANEFTPGMYHYSLICNGNEVDTKRMIITE